MSQKSSRKYFPNYQIRRNSCFADSGLIEFQYGGVFFTTKMPLFGATQTQKAIMQWASLHDVPPVISVWHEAPVASDRAPFHPDLHWLHKSYAPYAMAMATLDCLGEAEPRRVKVYFCNSANWDPDTKTMFHGKAVDIVPVKSEALPEAK
jgi:hypothetical protein